MMKLPLSLFALAGLLFLIAGCGKAPQTILGVQPAAASTATVKELASAPKSQKVTLQGEMIEKCPVAGCWFILRDKTGTVRVDTKAAGFVVSDVPLHTNVTVSGAVTPGTQPGLSATGLSY
jgi:uncharacterized protein YdeI (BOF family)